MGIWEQRDSVQQYILMSSSTCVVQLLTLRFGHVSYPSIPGCFVPVIKFPFFSLHPKRVNDTVKSMVYQVLQ